MRTLALFFFILLSLFFLPSPISAQEACVETVCPPGALKRSPTECAQGGLTGNPVPPVTPMCAAGKIPSNPRDLSKCFCNPAGTVAAPTPPAPPTAQPTPCTGPSCSNGGGQLCWIAPGSPDNGKPVPAGTVPAAGTKTGILTAIGCIPTEPQSLIEGLLRYGTLAAGGIAFLLMILAAFQMITAEGNPNVIKASQEKFYSAIIGLLLIIFSVLLLQVIGVDLLGLRGFGS